MKLAPLFFALLCLFIASCSSEEEDPFVPTAPITSVSDFLDEILDIMETHSINRNEIDWADFRSRVKAEGLGSTSTDNIDAAIRLALEMLGDNHSFYRKRIGTFISAFSGNCSPFDLEVPALPEDIGYVRVRGFSGGSQSSEALTFAINIQNQIRTQDTTDIAGWIVDLRGNTGGNMWPMLAGIGPILGEGISGYFIGPDSTQQAWGYLNGSSRIGGNNITTLTTPHELQNPNPKVAVLTDRAVSSSGEAITIAFIGREKTKSFGRPTCGLSTANSTFNLSNGSTLFLTTSYMADRNRVLYGVPVNPDQPANRNEIFDLAIDYLRE